MAAMLEMRGVSKSFAGVRALRDVTFTVEGGEIHALVGENGAGKSTLMKVLSGVYPYGSYEGSIVFDGEERRFRDINDSEALGIIIIHQELALIPSMTIAENIFLSHPPARFGVIDRDAVYQRTRELLVQVGLRESPDTLVTDLGIGKQQLVEIAKALSKRVRMLILDEPTASLNETDSAALLDRLVEFRRQGIASILISHKLKEVERVADRITVLRDGRTVDGIDCRAETVDEQRIIRSMVNRDLDDRFPERVAMIGEPVLEVKNWSVHHPVHPDRQVIRNINFTVRRGEVVGIAGLNGAGRTEFAMSLFGHAWGVRISGRLVLEGRETNLSSVAAAIGAGLAYASEDRKQLGLILADDVRKNVTLASLHQVASRRVIDEFRELKAANEYRQRMQIRCADVYQETGHLSGGNQQKVVLSKWLMTDPKVLILDEPTRGIDVGAKYEIYRIINELAAAGKGVVMISSEMPELIGICDRIYVMNEGAFVGEFDGAEATQEMIMGAIMRNDRRTDNGARRSSGSAKGRQP
ncbi:sugar ABC transporter ATP-binding protein [Xanthobacteraceae bacterium Astr-EGSB]|uniref:multiple monosaccharide ABC transporter ATP-binding protein n=1 Tax=Astrobacterium formosum TaxID=3069710 RepID=UPI0027B5412C|nr:sugar ABC transporter ATP-binding protein [Xanthobacteraceae bacterium Astr-EGSB]